MANDADRLRACIRDVADFPRPGIVFRDITPLLADAGAFAFAVAQVAGRFSAFGVDKVVGIEARGFIAAAPVALAMHAGFVPMRKAGKLPGVLEGEDYALEYGVARLEVHADAISAGERVLIVDDVLATGGTALAATHLVERLGGKVVGLGFFIGLGALGGRDRLGAYEVATLVDYG
ncbi:MAG: adenine phosphoribosyltransferase [Acidimicrobiales bacterium]